MGNKQPHTREFCECGAAIHYAGPYKAEIMRVWGIYHSGPGHRERITAKEAERVRAELSRSVKQRSPSLPVL